MHHPHTAQFNSWNLLSIANAKYFFGEKLRLHLLRVGRIEWRWFEMVSFKANLKLLLFYSKVARNYILGIYLPYYSIEIVRSSALSKIESMSR